MKKTNRVGLGVYPEFGEQLMSGRYPRRVSHGLYLLQVSGNDIKLKHYLNMLTYSKCNMSV